MAKTESTAVNQLISNLQTQRPLPVDPSEDLLFKVPAPVSVPVERRARARTSPAAREVASLPRAANGTAEHGAVRMSAPQPRGASIPPLPKAAQSSRSGIPLPRLSAPMSIPASNPNITLPPLPTSLLKVDARTMPPPPRTLPRPSGSMEAQGTPAPELVARRSPLPPPLTKSISAPVTAPISAQIAVPKAPIVAAIAPAPRRPTPDAVPVRPLTDMTSNQAWFEHTPIADDLEPGGNTEHVPTQAHALRALLGKLAVPMVGLVMIGIFVGGYVAFSGEGGKPHHNVPAKQVAAAEPVAPTPTPIAAPVPVPVAVAVAAQVRETAPPPVAVAAPAAVAVAAPVAVAVAAPAPVAAPALAAVAVAVPTPSVETAAPPASVATHGVQLVDIRIDSQPSGATVMLIDRGKTSFLGTTPIAASLDRARRYDLIFTHDNKPTQIEHLDPKLTHHVQVILGKQSAAPAIPAVAQPVVQHVEQKKPAATHAMAEPTVAHAESKPAAPVATHAAPPKAETVVEAAPTAMVAAPPNAKGTLMISSKPPCQILIDGTATGLTTPQRSIALAPGNHKVTLVGVSDPTLTKSVTIGVIAGKPTKVIQDLMK